MWFLRSSEFTNWIEGTQGTLFCPGYPGVGKTIMAAAVTEHLLQTKRNDDQAVIYLYCNYQRYSEQTAQQLLCALLRQMILARLKVPNFVKDMYARHSFTSTRPPPHKIEQTLQRFTMGFKHVYLVIDALDECRSRGRRLLLKDDTYTTGKFSNQLACDRTICARGGR